MPNVADKKTDKAITLITKTNKKDMEFMLEKKLLEFIKS